MHGVGEVSALPEEGKTTLAADARRDPNAVPEEKANQTPAPSPGRDGQRAKPAEDEKPKTNKKIAIIGAVFLGVVLLGNIIYLYVTHQVDAAGEALSKASIGWLVAMGVLMIGNLVFGGAAYLITAWLDPETVMGVRDAISVEASGTFFGNLTPLSVGGLPGQIWRLCRAGYTPGEATAVQLARFSVYQVAQTIMATVLLLVYWGPIEGQYGRIIWVALAIVGFKVVQTAIIVLLCLFPNFVMRAGNWLISALKFWGLTKKLIGEARLEAWRLGIHEETTKFGTAFRQLAGAWRQMLIVLVISILQVGCFYATDCFALEAFGVHLGFGETLCLGTLVQLVATVVPTPGGTGGIEAAFLFFFSNALGSAALSCFLVWRVVTFYVYTGVCGAFTFMKSSHKGTKIYAPIQRFIGRNDVNYAGDGRKGD